jgi:lipopolysaccharide transport system ATP-binding protein
MAKNVIEVNGLSKRYRLGTIGTGRLTKDFQRWWALYRGKEDPFAKIDGMQTLHTLHGDFWALRDLSFEIKEGDVLGVIGSNGAGKSTLLKILSRITTPTTGEVRIRGRIASLLEVGTGFHPELTGRENVFLNGAILGMTKAEIRLKLDEIIAFSGVEEHIDTPVKRYSSGMYVRLAFAVAAHLEPEILIVDEVLAVGDAEFQKKCIGKMSKVASEGRTILFVSHNMVAVESLCTKGLVLSNGTLDFSGKIGDAVSHYLNKTKIQLQKGARPVIDLVTHPNKQYESSYGLQKAEVFVNGIPSLIIMPGDDLVIKLHYRLRAVVFNLVVGIVIKSPQDIPFIGINNLHTNQRLDGNSIEGAIVASFPNFGIYGEGACSVDLYFGDNQVDFDTIFEAFALDLQLAPTPEGQEPLNLTLNRVYQPLASFSHG